MEVRFFLSSNSRSNNSIRVSVLCSVLRPRWLRVHSSPSRRLKPIFRFHLPQRSMAVHSVPLSVALVRLLEEEEEEQRR